MPKGVAAKGTGTKQPDDAPVGYRHHSWVAALTIRISQEELKRFHNKAMTNTSHGKPWAGKVTLERAADVLDCYCERCGVRAGPGADTWCPRHPTTEWGLPR